MGIWILIFSADPHEGPDLDSLKRRINSICTLATINESTTKQPLITGTCSSILLRNPGEDFRKAPACPEKTATIAIAPKIMITPWMKSDMVTAKHPPAPGTAPGTGESDEEYRGKTGRAVGHGRHPGTDGPAAQKKIPERFRLAHAPNSD